MASASGSRRGQGLAESPFIHPVKVKIQVYTSVGVNREMNFLMTYE
jgi:hypothetical protein